MLGLLRAGAAFVAICLIFITPAFMHREPASPLEVAQANPPSGEAPKSLLPRCEIQAIEQLGNVDLKTRAASLMEKRGARLDAALGRVRQDAQALILKIPLAEAEMIYNDPALSQQRLAAMQQQGDARIEAIWKLRTAVRIRIHGGIPVNDH